MVGAGTLAGGEKHLAHCLRHWEALDQALGWDLWLLKLKETPPHNGTDVITGMGHLFHKHVELFS